MQSRANAPLRGHLVIVSLVAETDFATTARLAAALLGTYMATPKAYSREGPTEGCQFEARYRKSLFQLAVSADITEEFPTVPAFLKAVAMAPGSNIELFSQRKLQKQFLADKAKQPWKHRRVFCSAKEWQGLKNKLRPLFNNAYDFPTGIRVTVPDAVCLADSDSDS